MFGLSKIFGATLMLGSGLFFAGCAATAPATTANDAVSGKAVTCEKCQVTYAQVPDTAGKSRIVGYKTQKSMECPDCKTAAQNFFATGKLQHTCKTCGDS